MRTDKRVHTDVFNAVKRHIVKVFVKVTTHKWEDNYRGFNAELVRMAKVGECLVIHAERLKSFIAFDAAPHFHRIGNTEAIRLSLQNFLHQDTDTDLSTLRDYHIDTVGYIDRIMKMVDELSKIPEMGWFSVNPRAKMPTINLVCVTEHGVYMKYCIIVNNEGIEVTPRSIRNTDEWASL